MCPQRTSQRFRSRVVAARVPVLPKHPPESRPQKRTLPSLSLLDESRRGDTGPPWLWESVDDRYEEASCRHRCDGRVTFFRNFENRQIRQLLDVVAVAHPVVAEDVAVVAELLDDAGASHFVLVDLMPCSNIN